MWRDGVWIHPHHFPNMAVWIFEAAAIHEAVVLHGRGVRLAAGTARLINQVGHFFATIRRQTQQYLRAHVRIDDPLTRELAPLVVGEKHRVNRLGEHHARRGIVTECGIVDRANGLVERL